MQANTNIFNRIHLKERVKVLPRELGSNVHEVILAKLRTMLEGFCSRHGYVRPGSIKIADLSSGKVDGSSLNGDVIYNVTLSADICNPVQGQVVPARIVNSNKFGLLAHSGIEIDGKYTTILEIVVARHNFHGKPEEIPLDSVRVGDDVFVEVLGRTFELHDNKICVAGMLLKALGPSARRILLAQPHTHQNASDDEAFADDAEEFDVEHADDESTENDSVDDNGNNSGNSSVDDGNNSGNSSVDDGNSSRDGSINDSEDESSNDVDEEDDFGDEEEEDVSDDISDGVS